MQVDNHAFDRMKLRLTETERNQIIKEYAETDKWKQVLQNKTSAINENDK